MKRLLIVSALAAFSSVAAAQTVPVTLLEYKIIMKDTIPAGTITFRITNDGVAAHAFHIKAVVDKGVAVEKESPQIARRQVGVVTLALQPGTYDIWCPLAENSHKIAGMAKKLVVIPKPPPPNGKRQ